MDDFEHARAQMLDGQLRAGGIFDTRVLEQMRTVPRERFVSDARRNLAYLDGVQWLGDRQAGRFMAAPATEGKLLKLANISADEDVLDVGAASGYSTALIAGLARSVTGLEQNTALAAMAVSNLASLGLTNAHIVAGDLDRLGAASFNVVLVQGALDTVPPALFAALRDGGRLIAPLRAGAVVVVHVFQKSAGKITSRPEFNTFLPPLFGAQRIEEFVF